MYAAPVARIHTPTASCFYTDCFRCYSVFDSLEALWSREADDWDSNRLTYIKGPPSKEDPFSSLHFSRLHSTPLPCLSGIFLHTCQRNPSPGLRRGHSEESGSPHRPPPPCSSPMLSALLSGMMSISCLDSGSHGLSQTHREAHIFLGSFLGNFFHWAKRKQTQASCRRPVEPGLSIIQH